MNIHTFTKLKKISAFILMLCFFLPLSQCSGVKSITVNKQVAEQEKVVENTEAEINRFNPVKAISIDEPVESFVLILCFFFSLPFIFLSNKVKGYVKKVSVFVVELLFAGFSAYILVMSVVVLREPLIAGYLSLLTITYYLLATFCQLIYTIRRGSDWNII
jgi:hypothetical protein